MSTFNGQMPEFPDIRVDYFRHAEGVRPPLACFLTHIHSDHLAGLESLKSPFIYCSAATRELLLRLEKYPHRINFQLGILESRKQHFKHLKALLKSIPLQTPTTIELQPGNEIQVTLFDANHCPGAVMFLFEGNGMAVLYTGDIRAEPWFVNNLTRSPFLVEYSSSLKTLDCIYLDTSFTEDLAFPTKAEGLTELLQKVAKYPADTKFHFTAWTFGYEEVWMALSKALKSQIHVDHYKMRLYKALSGETGDTKDRSGPFISPEGPILTGYKCGNSQQAGCLTIDQGVRLHSCEKGTPCSEMDENTVWIRPIITRTASGVEIGEIGIGGGGGDLKQSPELELGTDAVVQQLITIFHDANSSILDAIRNLLLGGLHSTRRVLSLDGMGLEREADEMDLEDLGKILASSIKTSAENVGMPEANRAEVNHGTVHTRHGLPKTITFPYSRHSSYPELCHFVQAFKPKDVYPCTVDEKNWHEGVGMKSLFGHLCSGHIFRHDLEMMEKFGDEEIVDEEAMNQETSGSENSSQEDRSSVEPEPEDVNDNVDDAERPSKRQRTAATSLIVLGRSSSSASPQLDDINPVDNPEWISYFDKRDNVYRCKSCGWEVWTPTGQCSGCGCGTACYSVAVHDPMVRPAQQPGEERSKRRPEQIPEFTGLSTALDADGQALRVEDLVDKFLDNQSAYSSVVDENESEYEIDSFIDDEPFPSTAGGNTDSDMNDDESEFEADYRSLYQNLQKEYQELAEEHELLTLDHRELRQDVFGFASDTDLSDLEKEDYTGSSDSENMEVNTPIFIPQEIQFDVPRQDIITSSMGKASQDSLASNLDTVVPVEYSELETETEAGDMPNISLISAGDNHTTIEIEL